MVDLAAAVEVLCVVFDAVAVEVAPDAVPEGMGDDVVDAERRAVVALEDEDEKLLEAVVVVG